LVWVEEFQIFKIKIMNRDYPLSPTPQVSFMEGRAGNTKNSKVSVKETPNRTVVKRTTVSEDGSKKVVKEVDSKRGYKVVRKVDGKRTELGKSY
jgi:hypothetical protein